MIEFLFFFTACIVTPLYEDYYCQIQIFLIESQNEMKNIWYQETGNVTAKDNSLRGIHAYLRNHDLHVIWIWKGHEGDYTAQGCNILWHELLHVKGYTHKTMSYCNWSEFKNE